MKSNIILAILFSTIFSCGPKKDEDKKIDTSNSVYDYDSINHNTQTATLDTLIDTIFVKKAPKHFEKPFTGQKETQNEIKYTYSLNSTVDSSKMVEYDQAFLDKNSVELRHYQTYNTRTIVSFYISDTLIFEDIYQPLLNLTKDTDIKRIEYNFQFAPWYTLEYYNVDKKISIIESDRDWNTFFVLDSAQNTIFKDQVNNDGSYMFRFDKKSNSFITNHSIYNINRNTNTELTKICNSELLEYANIDSEYMILIFKRLSPGVDNLFILDLNFNIIRSENFPVKSRSGIINDFNEQKNLLLFSNISETLISIEKDKPDSLNFINYKNIQEYQEGFEYHELLTFSGDKTYSKEYVYIDTINNFFRRSSYEFVGVD